MIAYCINLPERPEKWQKAAYEFRKLPFNVLKFNATKTSPGWEGCRKSHLGVLEHARINYPNQIIAVFEDDVQWNVSNPWHEIEKCMYDLPKDWDMLYLGATLQQDLIPYTRNLYRLKKGWTTHAMIMNPANGLFEYILENNGGGRKIDVFYADVIQEKFKCFISNPMIAIQRDGYSDILNKPVNNGAIIKDYYKKHAK